MSREQFMSRLTELLQDLSPAEREEAIQYYNDYLDDAGDENLPEVIASLGTPEELALSIRSGLNEGGAEGEFTESGYHVGRVHSQNEIMMTDPADAQKTGEQGTEQAAQNEAPEFEKNPDNAYYQKQYYENTQGKGVYGRRSTDEGELLPKKKMSAGMLALVITLAIFTFPLWIGLLAAVFGIAFSLLCVLAALAFSFVVIAVALVVGGLMVIGAGILEIAAAPAGALCIVGAGLILLAFGVLFTWLLVFLCAKGIPAAWNGIKWLWNKIFHRGGKRA